MSFSTGHSRLSSSKLWFDALWQCLSVNQVHQWQPLQLWFDALWQCLSVERLWRRRYERLWFDALWQCLSVTRDEKGVQIKLWFDALWQCLSVYCYNQNHIFCCDLMLFDNVFQWNSWTSWWVNSCDLMLFDNVFQFNRLAISNRRVVIWCSLTMSFSHLLWREIQSVVVIWCSLTMSFS